MVCDMKKQVRAAIERAIEIKGSEQALAEVCGVTQPAIWKAKTTGKISVDLAKAIHIATAGEVPGSAMRPDVWALPEHVPVPVPA